MLFTVWALLFICPNVLGNTDSKILSDKDIQQSKNISSELNYYFDFTHQLSVNEIHQSREIIAFTKNEEQELNLGIGDGKIWIYFPFIVEESTKMTDFNYSDRLNLIIRANSIKRLSLHVLKNNGEVLHNQYQPRSELKNLSWLLYPLPLSEPGYYHVYLSLEVFGPTLIPFYLAKETTAEKFQAKTQTIAIAIIAVNLCLLIFCLLSSILYQQRALYFILSSLTFLVLLRVLAAYHLPPEITVFGIPIELFQGVILIDLLIHGVCFWFLHHTTSLHPDEQLLYRIHRSFLFVAVVGLGSLFIFSFSLAFRIYNLIVLFVSLYCLFYNVRAVIKTRQISELTTFLGVISLLCLENSLMLFQTSPSLWYNALWLTVLMIFITFTIFMVIYMKEFKSLKQQLLQHETWKNHILQKIDALTNETQTLIAGNYHNRINLTEFKEVRQLAFHLNKLAHVLEDSRISRKQWIADISHELRTPLTILKGEMEAIIDGIRPLGTKSVESFYHEISRLTKLVQDLHELSLSDSAKLTLNKKKASMEPIISQQLEMFSSTLEKHSFVINTDLLTGTCFLNIDPDRMTQLVSNLLKNTLKYTQVPGKLSIRTYLRENQWVLVWEDSEPGVPDEMLGMLFNRLFRVERSRSSASGGSGLGLALCKSIVEAHGGKIDAKPSNLGGLRMEVILPLYELQ
ncbi:MAG: ATP-binding protein [Pseudomonadota bacterium]